MSTSAEPSSTRSALRKSAILLAMTSSAALILGLSGCGRDLVKSKSGADKEVYRILEQKWEKDFGHMANYQVSDSTPDSAEIADRLPDSRGLSLAEAVALATQYNREYQGRKEDLYQSALALTGTRHQYARRWFGAVDATYVSDGGNNDMSAIGGGAGVNQDHLWGDTMFVTTGLALDWTRFLSGDPRKTLTSMLTATIAAPLLGVGEAKLAREELTLAERRVLYEIRRFSRYRKTFVVGFIEAYYGVLQQRNSVLIQEASYKSRIESTNQLRMEVEVGQRPAYDLGEAEQNLLSAEQDLVSARQRYEQVLDEFKISLGLPTDAEISLDPGELNILEQDGIESIPYSAEEAIQMALMRRLDLANTRDGLGDSARDLELKAQGLGIQMGLTAGANVSGTPDTEAARLQFDDGRYELGLNADLALDQKTQRNDYRRAMIAYQRAQRDYDLQVDRVKQAVRNAYRDLAETAETYRIQQIGLRLAQQRVEVEKLSLQYGRGTVRLLLDSEDALVQAQDRVIGALVDHTIARLRFFQDVGVLQVKPDGMWEQNTL